MTLEQARERLLDYAYGEMAPGDVVAFEAITRQDLGLQADLDDVAFVRRAVSGWVATELPAMSRRRILVAAHRASGRRAWARRWLAVRASFLSPAFLGTAAVAVAVGLAVPWFWQQGRVDRETVGTAADPQEQVAASVSEGSASPRPVPADLAPAGEPAARNAVEAESPRAVAKPGTVDVGGLLAEARAARASGRLSEALELCRKALAKEPTGGVLADVLAEAAEMAGLMSRRVEADAYLERLERLPGGAERAARIRGR